MGRRVWRVRDHASFEALRRARHRARRGGIAVTWVPDPAHGPPRVAYAVGRRVGGAVLRNRLRRRLRAAITDLAPGLPAGTYLVSAGPDAVDLSPEALRMNLKDAIRSASRPEVRR